MTSIAMDVLDYLEANPGIHKSLVREMLEQIPASQWALPGGHWVELSRHCANRVEFPQEPRFMNRLAIYSMSPADRCLYRSPGGRGLAWFASGGGALAYGRCEQRHCEHARCSSKGEHS